MSRNKKIFQLADDETKRIMVALNKGDRKVGKKMDNQEKIKNLDETLKILRELVVDHINDCDEVPLTSIELIKSAVEIYESMSEDGES